MTTLRDYILDCRCPNCGTAMQQQKPRRRGWGQLINRLFVFALTVDAFVVGPIQHRWSEAAFVMAVAIFLSIGESSWAEH